MRWKLVIVVRRDLKLRPGKLAAQVAHAATASVLYGQDDKIQAWIDEGAMKKVVLQVKTATDLQALSEAAIASGIVIYKVVDAGKTVFHGEPTMTCVALGPDTDERIDAITGGLKLL